MSMIEISIAVPTFNRDKCLKQCISSLVDQIFPVEKYEIMIIDNASTDYTQKVTEEAISLFSRHNISYIYEPTPGLLSGRHRGALEAKGEILVFIDDDIEADENWLSAIHESFQDQSVQLVGGRNLPKYEANPPDWLKYFWIDHPHGKFCEELSLLDFGTEILKINANYVWGLNFSIRRQALFDLGGFHPDCIPKHLQYLQGDGETGLTTKANQLGYKAIYQPKALVLHQVPQSRMTHEYFERRYFYQGVCNSYTTIRELGHLPTVDKFNRLKEQVKSPLRKLKHQIFHQSNLNKEGKLLKSRFYKAIQVGSEFHQNAIHKNPMLLNWVLKSDYWDYKLPIINLSSLN
jgi:glucosyl-dolichyl phosphate glucuronosyltransferase